MNKRIAPCKSCAHKDYETFECTEERPCEKWHRYIRCLRINDLATNYILELRHGKWQKYKGDLR